MIGYRILMPLLLLFLAVPTLLVAEETLPLIADLPYRAERSNPVTYDVDFSVVVTAPYKTKRLEVWLPLPPSDAAQEVSEGRLSTFPDPVEPQVASEPLYGNRFAYFQFTDPQGAQIVRHRFRIKVWQLDWRLDAAKVQQIEQWPADFERYRRSESQAVVVDDRFREMLTKIVPQPIGAMTDLERVMTYVQENFQYDHAGASLTASSLQALETHRGHCSDYHGFCAAMGRAMGYPTRVVYGINPFPKASPSHCKFEAFLPPYGWVTFDVSETQHMIAAIGKDRSLDAAAGRRLTEAARSRLASGFRDNTWFLQTRGTDYELVPKASRRMSVVRTAHVEADGVPLPEPDPSDADQQRFSWMTVHKYVADRQVAYPYKDYGSLEPYATE
jgi:transglutaminase-like putative cysteine protease